MRLALVTVAAVLLPATAAPASTVSVAALSSDFGVTSLQYEAAPGETNAFTVDYAVPTTKATVVDPGATITVGSGCTLVNQHTATCETGAGLEFSVTHVVLGDLNDSATSTGSQLPKLVAEGGPGDDTLTAPALGSGGDNELNGGPGADHLIAIKGSAVMIEGDPDGDPKPDVMEAGDSGSTVSYKDRTDGVTIDLDGGTGGAPGENDVLKNITAGYGGAGADTLISGRNTLFFEGGKGADSFVNSRLGDSKMDWTGGKGIDKYKCASPSREVINDPQPGELIGPKCTFIVDTDWTLSPTPIKHTTMSLTFRMECPTNDAADDRHRDCKATMRLTDPKSGGDVGIGTFSQPKGPSSEKVKVVIALTKLGQKLMRQRKPVDIALSAKGYSTLRWTIPIADVG